MRDTHINKADVDLEIIVHNGEITQIRPKIKGDKLFILFVTYKNIF